MNRTFIIHFSPAELYPPVQNFINYCVELNTKHKIYLFTTSSVYEELSPYKAAVPNIRIIRLGRVGHRLSAAARYWSYLYFNLACLCWLVVLRPRNVFYYETLSAFPACLYKGFVNRKSRLFIHYHEYTSPTEYRRGMVLNRWFHRLERKLYARSTWVSHTNVYRMEMFKKDLEPIAVPNSTIMPNYPSKAWCREAAQSLGKPVRFVYAGALSLDTMFTKEFAVWIAAQGEEVRWDIYSYNITSAAKEFLSNLKAPNIFLYDGVDYQSLPELLRRYHVGVILYKGHIPNYIYNAPNKLFEYLSCGLDVWFARELKGAYPYITKGGYPKVIPVDFAETSKLNLAELTDRRHSQLQPHQYFYQDIYHSLYGALTSNSI